MQLGKSYSTFFFSKTVWLCKNDTYYVHASWCRQMSPYLADRSCINTVHRNLSLRSLLRHLLFGKLIGLLYIYLPSIDDTIRIKHWYDLEYVGFPERLCCGLLTQQVLNRTWKHIHQHKTGKRDFWIVNLNKRFIGRNSNFANWNEVLRPNLSWPSLNCSLLDVHGLLGIYTGGSLKHNTKLWFGCYSK